MKKYYISGQLPGPWKKWATVQVDTDINDIIIRGAPLVTKFIGQPMSNFVKWLQADVVEEICGSSHSSRVY